MHIEFSSSYAAKLSVSLKKLWTLVLTCLLSFSTFQVSALTQDSKVEASLEILKLSLQDQIKANKIARQNEAENLAKTQKIFSDIQKNLDKQEAHLNTKLLQYSSVMGWSALYFCLASKGIILNAPTLEAKILEKALQECIKSNNIKISAQDLASNTDSAQEKDNSGLKSIEQILTQQGIAPQVLSALKLPQVALDASTHTAEELELVLSRLKDEVDLSDLDLSEITQKQYRLSVEAQNNLPRTDSNAFIDASQTLSYEPDSNIEPISASFENSTQQDTQNALQNYLADFNEALAEESDSPQESPVSTVSENNTPSNDSEITSEKAAALEKIIEQQTQEDVSKSETRLTSLEKSAHVESPESPLSASKTKHSLPAQEKAPIRRSPASINKEEAPQQLQSKPETSTLKARELAGHQESDSKEKAENPPVVAETEKKTPDPLVKEIKTKLEQKKKERAIRENKALFDALSKDIPQNSVKAKDIAVLKIQDRLSAQKSHALLKDKKQFSLPRKDTKRKTNAHELSSEQIANLAQYQEIREKALDSDALGTFFSEQEESKGVVFTDSEKEFERCAGVVTSIERTLFGHGKEDFLEFQNKFRSDATKQKQFCSMLDRLAYTYAFNSNLWDQHNLADPVSAPARFFQQLNSEGEEYSLPEQSPLSPQQKQVLFACLHSRQAYTSSTVRQLWESNRKLPDNPEEEDPNNNIKKLYKENLDKAPTEIVHPDFSHALIQELARAEAKQEEAQLICTLYKVFDRKTTQMSPEEYEQHNKIIDAQIAQETSHQSSEILSPVLVTTPVRNPTPENNAQSESPLKNFENLL